MKIYPSNHVFKQSKDVKMNTIPLGYIEKQMVPTNIVVEKSTNFMSNSIVKLSPYDAFDTDDFLLFDNDRKITKANFKFRNHKYIYEPEGSVEFTPEEFSVSALIKKNMIYNTAVNYDLKIAVSNIQEWPNLMSIFGDAPIRGICPANISVNGMSTQDSSLINGSIDESDFVFISTPDGVHYHDNTNINFDEILNGHANIWLSVTNDQKMFFPLRTKSYMSSFKRPKLYNSDYEFTEKNYNYRVATHMELPEYLNKLILVNSILANGPESPIIILEKLNGGYIIISRSTLFDNLSDNAHFIYEVLMQIYLISYMKSATTTLWITDVPVDYIQNLQRPFGKTHKAVNIDDLLDKSISEFSGYNIMDIFVDNPYVMYERMDNNGNLHFKKLSGRVDPKKSKTDVSIYTTRNTVILYKTNTLQKIEDSVRIDTSINDQKNRFAVTVNPFCSSSYRLCLTKPVKLIIPDITKEYSIVALPVDADGESKLMLTDRAEDVPDSAVHIAQVRVIGENEERCVDIRQRGGGLPEREADDYDMMDIGNLYGRPYRIGTSLIVKLPRRLEQYDEKIQSSIEQYKNAGDLVTVLYR